MIHHIPRKRFGQHFLVDPSIIDAIINAINPHKDDVMVEIGPGLGAITEPLLHFVNALQIIEIDRDLIKYWRNRYPERIVLHACDILDFDYQTLPKGFRLVGNLPYNISTPILFGLYGAIDRLQDAHFMLQKEVVERLTADPGSKTYGRLSVMMQYAFDLEWLFDVPASSFNPPPKVTSAVMRMIPKSNRVAVNMMLFGTVVRTAFSQRRKKLSNTLKHYLTASDYRILEIDPNLRAEALSVEDFIKITNWVEKNKNLIE